MYAACFRHLLLVAALVTAASPARAGSACMYGPDGSVVYRPAGAECRDVAQADAKAGEFVAPRPTAEGPWLEIRPGDEHLFAWIRLSVEDAPALAAADEALHEAGLDPETLDEAGRLVLGLTGGSRRTIAAGDVIELQGPGQSGGAGGEV